MSSEDININQAPTDKLDCSSGGSSSGEGDTGGESPTDSGIGADDSSNGKKRKDMTATADDSDDRKAERRAANRRSAFQSRQRRKILIEDLQKTVATLSKDNTELRTTTNQLRAKLETAMLENQLLRKQAAGAGGAQASAGAPGANGVAPASGLPAAGGASAKATTGNTNGNTESPAGPTVASASQILNGLNNADASAPGGASGALAPSNSGPDPLMAARLALAAGGMGHLGNLSNLSALASLSNGFNKQQQQQSQPPPATGFGGGGIQQQLAMLLAGGRAPAAPLPPPGVDPSQMALLQAALGRSAAGQSMSNDTLSPAMRAFSQQNSGLTMQASAATAGAAPSQN